MQLVMRRYCKKLPQFQFCIINSDNKSASRVTKLRWKKLTHLQTQQNYVPQIEHPPQAQILVHTYKMTQGLCQNERIDLIL